MPRNVPANRRRDPIAPQRPQGERWPRSASDHAAVHRGLAERARRGARFRQRAGYVVTLGELTEWLWPSGWRRHTDMPKLRAAIERRIADLDVEEG